jgi:hypothetical protein
MALVASSHIALYGSFRDAHPCPTAPASLSEVNGVHARVLLSILGLA